MIAISALKCADKRKFRRAVVRIGTSVLERLE